MESGITRINSLFPVANAKKFGRVIWRYGNGRHVCETEPPTRRKKCRSQRGARFPLHHKTTGEQPQMTSTTITNETSKLSVSLLSIAIAIVGTFLKAWVATILWGWFITPLTAVPTPGLWLMCGLAVFVALFSARWQPERNDNGPIDVLARAFVFGVVVPFACLGFGWIYASLGGLA